MKTLTTLKLTGAAILAMGLMSGTALAGEGHKDCNKTKTTAQSSTTSATTGYVTTSTSVAATSETAKTKMKVMSFDDALAKCTKYQAKDLQACIDKKTGKTKPAS